MGAAAAVEMNKPCDASEIRASASLETAKHEIIRLRGLLGHLAKDYGIEAVVYDASDIVLGENDMEDFERCLNEISHIRNCLKLNTQDSKRVDRKYSRSKLPAEDMDYSEESRQSQSDWSGDEDEKYPRK